MGKGGKWRKELGGEGGMEGERKKRWRDRGEEGRRVGWAGGGRRWGRKGRVVMETFPAMVPWGPKYGSEGP